MRTSAPSLRLEAARIKRVHNGGRGPLLPFHELNDPERQFLIDELTKDVTVRRLNVSDPANESIFDKMMLDILTDYGVMCPHPKTALVQKNYGLFCRNCECDLVPTRSAKVNARAGK